MEYTQTEGIGIFLLGLSIGFNIGVVSTLMYRAFRLRQFKKNKVQPYNFAGLLRNSVGLALLTLYFFLLIFTPGNIPQDLSFMVMAFAGALFGNEFTQVILQKTKKDEKDKQK